MENHASGEETTPSKETPMKLMKLMPHVYYSPSSLRKECNTKLNCPNATDNSFKFLGNHSTPPSRFLKIKNPFDAALASRLHLPTSSPSVFQKKGTPVKSDEKFRWTIEDIASLNPAPIEEYPTSQFEQPDDPEIESTAQANIAKYFNETKQIVPSPWGQKPAEKLLLAKDDCTPVKSRVSAPTRVGVAQTVLTLPPTLPAHVDEALREFCTYTADQQQSGAEDSSLYRRLFHHSDVSAETESEADYGALSPVTSPIAAPRQSTSTPSPQSDSAPGRGATLEDSPISPIAKSVTPPQPTPLETPANLSRRSNKRLHFSGTASVDTSLNLVPDAELLSPDLMSSLGTSILANEEDCTYSSVNWDMENRSITNLKKPSIDIDELKLDSIVQPAARRHQRVFGGAKKLSENFDESEKENMYMSRRVLRRSFSDVPCGSKMARLRCKSSPYAAPFERADSPFSCNYDETSIFSQNTHDTGYTSHTGGASSSVSGDHVFSLATLGDDATAHKYDVNKWQLDNLIASTPSKTSNP